MNYRLTREQLEEGINNILRDDPDALGTCVSAIYQDLEGNTAVEEYHQRHMTPSLGVVTVFDQKRAQDLMTVIADSIADKVVVEVGAGVGLLSMAMAGVAKAVYAIESDPAWSWAFTTHLYSAKPPNLTWIFGRAETMVGKLHADIGIIVTRSGHEAMQKVALELADKVIDVYDGISIEA